MRRLIVGLAVVVAMVAPAAVDASIVYRNDFEGAVGSEWSHAGTATTPVGGRRFLGIFQEDTVSLTLDLVGLHEVSLSFDLYVIQTWDGSQLVGPFNPDHTVGPDLWSVGIEGGPDLLSTTFSVFDGTKPMHSFRDYPQAYPGDYPDLNPARTGASENDTLGYFEGDSVYSMSFSFLHAGPLVIDFAGDFPDFDPEEWGIDNVAVEANVIPEPSTLIIWSLLGSLTFTVGWWRRRNRR
jgi:hypothetical protein